MQPQITLSQALEGYLLHADARRLSPHTIADYTNTFHKFQQFLVNDPPLPPSPLIRSAPSSHPVITMANQDDIADLRNNVKRSELLKHASVRAANDAYAQGRVLTCTNLSILFHRGRSHLAQLI